MKDFFGNIQNLLIVVLVVLLFLMRTCQGGSDISEPQVITEVVTKWDTVQIEKTKYVPKWRDRVIYDTIPTNVDIDTAAILKDYYSKYIYTDTIKLDTLGSIIVTDTITQNRISFRDIQPNIFIPTTTITNTIYLNKREFFGGISVGATNQAVQNINGELIYVNKKRNAYGVGIGLNPQWQPIYTFRMYWKLGK